MTNLIATSASSVAADITALETAFQADQQAATNALQQAVDAINGLFAGVGTEFAETRQARNKSHLSSQDQHASLLAVAGSHVATFNTKRAEATSEMASARADWLANPEIDTLEIMVGLSGNGYEMMPSVLDAGPSVPYENLAPLSDQERFRMEIWGAALEGGGDIDYLRRKRENAVWGQQTSQAFAEVLPGFGVLLSGRRLVTGRDLLGQENTASDTFFAGLNVFGAAVGGSGISKFADDASDTWQLNKAVNKVHGAADTARAASRTSNVATRPAGFIATPRGVVVSAKTLARQGRSHLAGNFQGLAGKSMGEIIERVPSTWTMVPQDRGMGIKFLDEAGFERIRMHAPSARAPVGSNSASGWTLRVMDRAEDYYDNLGRLVPYTANEGHIPMLGNPTAP